MMTNQSKKLAMMYSFIICQEFEVSIRLYPEFLSDGQEFMYGTEVLCLMLH